MSTQIKICGIKTEDEVALINRYPVSYMGLIFAKSKRQVSLEKAAYLRAMVRGDIKVVGVFMDQDPAFIQEAIDHCDLDGIQLHGDETNAFIAKFDLPVWKSIAVKGPESLALLKRYSNAQGLLIDTYHQGATGGTGRAFNWDLVKDIEIDQQLILAGGLSPDNVRRAIKVVNPDILDLNSGLEVDLMKDPDKVKQLFEVLNDLL